MIEQPNSFWLRSISGSEAHARRGDGVSIRGWTASDKLSFRVVLSSANPEGYLLACHTLEEAIQSADEMKWPGGWCFNSQQKSWVCGEWTIAKGHEGWIVEREVPNRKVGEPERERATVATFASADRARRWAEIRFDREGVNLRGPKPRAGAKSSTKLPDVRATKEERERFVQDAQTLDLSFSAYTRMALEFLHEEVRKGAIHLHVQEGKPVGFTLSETLA